MAEGEGEQPVELGNAVLGDPFGLVVLASADRADVWVVGELVLPWAANLLAVRQRGSSPRPEQYGHRVKR